MPVKADTALPTSVTTDAKAEARVSILLISPSTPLLPVILIMASKRAVPIVSLALDVATLSLAIDPA